MTINPLKTPGAAFQKNRSTELPWHGLNLLAFVALMALGLKEGGGLGLIGHRLEQVRRS